MTPAVGLVGLGRMGGAIGRRLREHGLTVVGWDAEPAAVDRFAAAGFAVEADAAAVARAAPIVLTSVTDDAGVTSLFENAFLRVPLEGRLFVEMSTLRPATLRALEPRVTAAGARLVDAPVLGTIPNVANGTLFALVGGAPDDVARANAVLAPLTRRIAHLGPLGSGHAMKLAANLGLGAYMALLAEALALGAVEGLELRSVLDVLGDSAIAAPWLALRGGVLTGERDDVSLDLRTLRKDLVSALATGSAAGIAMPVAAGVTTSLAAAVAAGWGDRDIGELARFVRDEMVQRPAR